SVSVRVRVKNFDQLQTHPEGYRAQLQGTSAAATASATEKERSESCSYHAILVCFNPATISPRPRVAECLYVGTRTKVEVPGYRRVGVVARHTESLIEVHLILARNAVMVDRGT